jgi:hypothetical protein
VGLGLGLGVWMWIGVWMAMAMAIRVRCPYSGRGPGLGLGSAGPPCHTHHTTQARRATADGEYMPPPSLADNEGVFSPRCTHLAALASKAVDYQKNGTIVNSPNPEPEPEPEPDF